MELPRTNAKTLPKTAVHARLIVNAVPASKDKPKRALENNPAFTSTIVELRTINWVLFLGLICGASFCEALFAAQL